MKALVLILALAAAAAPAQPPRAAERSGRARLDPNQIICRSEQEVGSRLRGHLRCATRAQWIEQRRLDRQYAERAQTNRTYCGGICTRRMGHGH